MKKTILKRLLTVTLATTFMSIPVISSSTIAAHAWYRPIKPPVVNIDTFNCGASVDYYKDARYTFKGSTTGGNISKSYLPFSFKISKSSNVQAGIRSVAIDGKNIASYCSITNDYGWNSSEYVFNVYDNYMENLSTGSHRVAVVLYDPYYQNNTQTVSFTFYLTE